MHGRYFVTVEASTRPAMVKLAEFEFDLFHATARETADGGAIEGLLTLEEIGRVVDAGYKVTVEEPDSARSRAHETATFDEWLEGMSE